MPRWARTLAGRPKRIPDLAEAPKEILPQGERKPIDSATLTDFVGTVFRQKLEALKSLDTPMTEHWVLRESRGAIGPESIPAPDYGASEIEDAIKSVPTTDAYEELTDLLWKHNCAKCSFSPGDGNRKVWSRTVYGAWFKPSLHQVLWRSAYSSLVRKGEAIPWSVDERYLEETIHDVAYGLVNEGHLVRAYCLLPALYLIDPPLQVTDGITLRGVTTEDLLVLRSTSFSQKTVGFGLSDSPHPIAEIVMQAPDKTYNYRGGDDPFTMTEEALNRLKWGLYEVLGVDLPPSEGTLYLRNRHSVWPTEIDRGDSAGMVSYVVDQEKADRCGGLLGSLDSARESHPELDQAIWHFGRICLFENPRDALIEGVIALEALLITDEPGANSRRLRQNGVALLHDYVDSDWLRNRLRDIYGKRSAGVHGSLSRERETDLLRDAATALWILSKSIRASVDLIHEGGIDGDESMGRALKRILDQRIAGGSD